MVHSRGGCHAPATGDHARQRGRTLSCDTDHTRPAVGAAGQGVQTYPEIPRSSLLVWWSDHTRTAVPGRYAEKGSSDDHQARPPLARGSAACPSLSDIPRSANESRDPSRTILDKVIAGHLEIFPGSEHPKCGAWGRAVIMCPWCGRDLAPGKSCALARRCGHSPGSMSTPVTFTEKPQCRATQTPCRWEVGKA